MTSRFGYAGGRRIKNNTNERDSLMLSAKKTRAFLACGLLVAASTATLAAEPLADDYSTHAFVRNAGQYRADVAFVARLRTNQIFVLNDGRILHALPIERTSADSMSAWVVVEGLQGATVAPRGMQVAQQRVTFLRTAVSPPVSGENSYTALEWRNAWPGVVMRLQIVEDRTERVFLVAPGADPKSIALTYDGVHFTLDENGGLIAPAGKGDLTLSAPVAFQDTVHGRVPVEVRYVVDDEGTRVSFEVGAYDEHLPLTIDPVLQSTYFGFDGQSTVSCMAVDPATGDLIVAGYLQGLGVPGVAGGFQSVHSLNKGFVARIDAKLRRVIQATYIGGASPTLIKAVAIHPQSGEIYVAGRTNSPDFPGGGGGARPVLGGSRDDGFVSRFSPDLRQLRQTTFTNQGLKWIWAHDLAISATTGDVYVTGEGLGAGYLLRFNQQLTTQLGRVILEGNNVARAFSVALNQATGDVYVAGATLATVFPQIEGGAETAFQGEGGDGEAVFVARFNADLSQHLQSTYLSDIQMSLQPHVARPSPMLLVHPVSGEVYVAGMSNRTDLPTGGGAQPNFGGGQNDLAISRLSPDLRQKRGATYFGGSGYEEAGDLAFTPDGATVYLTGMTFSSDLPGTAGGAAPSAGGAFVASLSASLSTLHQTTYFTAQGNISGQAIAVHPSTSEVYFGGQCYDGVIETAGGLQSEYEGFSTTFGTGCLARFDALLAGGDDPDPDAFSFADQFAVAPGGPVTSAPIRIEGITAPVIASVTNGSFSIDEAPFDATAREVRRGETIRVRHLAAAGPGIATNTVLNVGSRSDTFTSVSAAGVDSAPDAFAFPARNPVAMNIDIVSAPVTVSGIDAPASISIANGEYSIDGHDFTAAAATINGGQSVVVRHRSAAAAATVTESTLTIGGVSASFRSTTDPVDSSVHPFVFLDVDNVTPDFLAVSDPIVVMGVTVSVPVSVVGGEWSTDGMNFRSDPGVVSNLTPIILRQRSGPAGTTVSATLTVGDQSDHWVLRQPQPGDTTPDAFSFTTVTNATPLTNVVSNDITITGVNVPVWIDVANAHFFDPASGLYLTSGYLSNGATTRLRVLTSRFPGASQIVLVRIGTVNATFEVRNAGGDSVPDPFDFIDQTGVATGIQVTSNALTLSGLIGDTTASATGCELIVLASGTVSGRVVNGSRVILRATSAMTADTTTSCTVDIGGVVDQFRVTTGSRDSTPDAFDFADQNGVAVGAQVISNEVIVSGLVGDTSASATGCELSVNSAAFGAATVRVVNGDRVRLRANASATAGATMTCAIDIGGVTDHFRVTTASPPGGGGSSGGGSSSSGGGGGGAFDPHVLLLLALLVISKGPRLRGR
jgi:hypothetical protein